MKALGVIRMKQKREWNYVYCNSEFVEDFSEFKQKLLKRTFYKDSDEQAINKPVLRLGYIIGQRDKSSYTINLRVSCFLDDNKKISTELFASFEGSEAFEYFKEHCNENIDIEFVHGNMTYIKTKELYSFNEMQSFIDVLDQFARLPNELYQEMQGACTLSYRENSSAERVADLNEINSQLKSLQKTNEQLLTQLSLQAKAISDLQDQVEILKSKEPSEKTTDDREVRKVLNTFF